ncbi:MAG: KH domain-containing protein, partial [Clostridiales bacterium]|nr:KH domain-containing protein [Clostridiales bacterium]
APTEEPPKAEDAAPQTEDVPQAEEAAPAEEPAPAAEGAEKAERPVQKKQRRERKKPANREPAPARPSVKEAPAVPAAEPVFSAPAEDDEVAQRITQFLTGLMAQLEVEATPAIQVSDTGVYSVELVGESLGALIGRRGETLDAIQQLTNYSINRGQTKRVRIHLDAEGYRAKREESLQRLAQKTANKAIKYRRNMMLEPMNAYERHVIHAALQDYDPCISTYSTGTEPNRRLVVAYNRNGR